MCAIFFARAVLVLNCSRRAAGEENGYGGALFFAELLFRRRV
jgi:hypothetical protein